MRKGHCQLSKEGCPLLKNNADVTTKEDHFRGRWLGGGCGFFVSVQFEQLKYNRQPVGAISFFEHHRMPFSDPVCFLQKSSCQLGAKFNLAHDYDSSASESVHYPLGRNHLYLQNHQCGY